MLFSIVRISIIWYNDLMIKKIFASHTAKQLFGAVVGMTVAGLVYLSIQYTSGVNITGLLVEPGVITESAGKVRINDITVDDGTLRRITSRADAVAKALEQAASNPSADTVTPMNERAGERRQARQFVTQYREQVAVVPLTFDNPVEDDSETALHSDAPAMQSSATLPNSGFGLNVLVLSALVFTGLSMRRRSLTA